MRRRGCRRFSDLAGVAYPGTDPARRPPWPHGRQPTIARGIAAPSDPGELLVLGLEDRHEGPVSGRRPGDHLDQPCRRKTGALAVYLAAEPFEQGREVGLLELPAQEA